MKMYHYLVAVPFKFRSYDRRLYYYYLTNLDCITISNTACPSDVHTPLVRYIVLESTHTLILWSSPKFCVPSYYSYVGLHK